MIDHFEIHPSSLQKKRYSIAAKIVDLHIRVRLTGVIIFVVADWVKFHS